MGRKISSVSKNAAGPLKDNQPLINFSSVINQPVNAVN